jgi:outer membrane protein OmpU
VIPVADNGFGDDVVGANDFVLAIEAEGLGGLFFGDTEVATEAHWDPGFAMASDGFTEQDNETVLRGTSVFNEFEVSLSAIVRDGGNDRPGDFDDDDEDELDEADIDVDSDRDYVDQIAFGASGAIGAFALDLAYQEESQLSGILFPDGDDADADPDGDDQTADVEDIYDSSNEDFNSDEIFGIAAGATFGGADLKFGYATNLTDDVESYGVLVRYPFGPVSASASYTFEPDLGEDSWRIGAEYTSGPFFVSAYYESEASAAGTLDTTDDDFGDEEFGIEAVYNPNELTTLAFGYIEDLDDAATDDDDLLGGEQDEGFYVAARQAIGENAYIEGSYSDFTDAGPDEVREGTTLLVGLTF